MGLQRLAISNPSAATSTTLYTSTNQLLASVIATNKSTTTSANVTVWIQPSGSASASQYAYIVYDIYNRKCIIYYDLIGEITNLFSLDSNYSEELIGKWVEDTLDKQVKSTGWMF